MKADNSRYGTVTVPRKIFVSSIIILSMLMVCIAALVDSVRDTLIFVFMILSSKIITCIGQKISGSPLGSQA